MKFSQVCFHEFGYELPPKVVTSADLELRLAPLYERLKLPSGRLELMSGIKERRFWPKGTLPSQGAVLAGRKALAASGIDGCQIEALFFTGVSRDLMEPATASFVHHELGLPPRCLIYDISNACLGFLDAVLTLGTMIELGQVKNGLIVTCETAEELVESTINQLLTNDELTRKTVKGSFASLTIGSGAVALVLGDRRCQDTGHYLCSAAYRANTAHNDLCRGGKGHGGGTLMATDSEALLIQGVETARATWEDFLLESGWEPQSIETFFCHQVGQAHARLLFETLELDPARNYETLDRLGNIGSASAPITMAMGIDNGRLRSGNRASVLGIGSGINCLMLGIQW
ncbi:MAG: 3-oxoacyl-ACP synthase III [Proteobacteria bacterium]|nr:3-oxoacyl-ACP synthase III [Pseudomonadota bacterium]MBU1686552.1 3-oxoacyl-ACP synthase III [Pseudomonadota bacterium]